MDVTETVHFRRDTMNNNYFILTITLNYHKLKGSICKTHERYILYFDNQEHSSYITLMHKLTTSGIQFMFTMKAMLFLNTQKIHKSVYANVSIHISMVNMYGFSHKHTNQNSTRDTQ